MKKIILIIFIALIATSCSVNKKSPRKAIEKYFSNYQKLNKSALENIDLLVDNESSLNSKQKKQYREILKNHYKSLKYEIKKEKIINDKAFVSIEIKVNNNIKVLKESDYKMNNFIDNNGNFLIEEFNNYKIDKLKKEKSKIKYKMIFNLHVKSNNWVIDNITKENQEKLLGIYDICI